MTSLWGGYFIIAMQLNGDPPHTTSSGVTPAKGFVSFVGQMHSDMQGGGGCRRSRLWCHAGLEEQAVVYIELGIWCDLSGENVWSSLALLGWEATEAAGTYCAWPVMCINYNGWGLTSWVGSQGAGEHSTPLSCLVWPHTFCLSLTVMPWAVCASVPWAVIVRMTDYANNDIRPSVPTRGQQLFLTDLVLHCLSLLNIGATSSGFSPSTFHLLLKNAIRKTATTKQKPILWQSLYRNQGEKSCKVSGIDKTYWIWILWFFFWENKHTLCKEKLHMKVQELVLGHVVDNLYLAVAVCL